MGLRMKNFNILGIHKKIWLLGGEFMKNWYRRGDCLKRRGGAWTVCRFKGGLGKKEGGGVFEEGLIPRCTLNLWVKLPQPEQVICLIVLCLLDRWDVLTYSVEDPGASCSLSWSWTAVSKASVCEMVDSRVCKRGLALLRCQFTRCYWQGHRSIGDLMLIDERSCSQFGHLNSHSTTDRKCTAKSCMDSWPFWVHELKCI